MRRRLLLAATATPLVLGVIAVIIPGCGSDEPPIDDICTWIEDPANCYRALHDEARTRCGEAFDPATTPADAKDTEPKGSFLRRDALDVCVLENGGQVKFDMLPPLEAFPVTALEFTRLDGRSEPCVKISYTNRFNVTLTVLPCTQNPDDAIPVCKDDLTGQDTPYGHARSDEEVVGGTFSVVSEEGRDIFNATCPPNSDGEVKTYRFNQNETIKCDGFDQFLPHAEIDSDPGGTVPPWEPDVSPWVGWVRFRLFYPPVADVTEIKGQPADIVQYFNCRIPPQDPCDDGIKNFFETDTDCGGPAVGEPAVGVPDGATIQRSCERCEIGQICQCHSDCKEGGCIYDGATGFFKCTDGGSPSDPGCPGAGGG
ncbi:MAG: hypothetical protein IT372_29095 [Polyangiaceae bacterium]|nr:hypothetical protein [Polyangiaceae bacterium]